MEIPEKKVHESVLDYSARLSGWYSGAHTAKIRKMRGQFFTPKKIAVYMAGLFDIGTDTFRILDPGAGAGVLTAALCDRILNEKKDAKIVVDVFENDAQILPVLRKVLESCQKAFKERSLSFEFNIHREDFICHNLHHLNGNGSLADQTSNVKYDLVISNPPYFKLKKDVLGVGLKRALSNHPNIYSVFMELSASMLTPGGELVFITPRSFCSGAYYRNFRRVFLKNLIIKNIHLFESRKDVFDTDEVLQENVILRAIKSDPSQAKDIAVSVSKNKQLGDLSSFKARYVDIVHKTNADIFIRIPTSPSDLDVLHLMDTWPNTLWDLGLEISTGPVVSFRAKNYQFHESQMELETVPLLWMHNLQGMEVVWPLKKNGKCQAILSSRETKPLLLKVKNFVLIKRFTSKEQQRRLYAAVLAKDEFPYELVGLENHLNYIHQPGGIMPKEMAVGIAALLNSILVDNYFRCLNGNTQVNASDLRNVPLPSKANILSIGTQFTSASSKQKPIDINSMISKVLNKKDSVVAISN
jgi:adenine-specific DNA-methyltransferase